MVQLTAEMLWIAFKGLKAKERNAFLERLIIDAKIRASLLDAAVIEARKHERTVPYSQVLVEARKRRASARRTK